MPGERHTVPALRLKQWLPEWDLVDFSLAHRRKPEPYIYLVGLPAGTLRALSGINRRTTAQREESGIDLGIQRRHDEERSREIRDFVHHGLPWSGMSGQRRAGEDLDLLRKPGFLPTAIVINIMTPGDERRGKRVVESEAVRIDATADGQATLSHPATSQGWAPTGPAPIEVIDGQHRLWAFTGEEEYADLQLPVVAYVGLDIAWQAYLFYTINVKPKRINTSLAFDLYPLLRTEDWLERADALVVYRETRAQELTEVLWRFPGSPWKDRIDMLGEQRGLVSQAAWVRSLLASFIKRFDGGTRGIGGLFGAPVGSTDLALPWSRAQQAALLVAAWSELRAAVARCEEPWTIHVRDVEKQEQPATGFDAAFHGSYTLLNTDQGVRAYMQVVNDLLYMQAEALELDDWADESPSQEPSNEAVELALATLARIPLSRGLKQIAEALASYDWRRATAPELPEAVRQLKGRFRGSSGYRELRRDLLVHLETTAGEPLDAIAASVREQLGLV